MGVLVARVTADEVESCSDWLWRLGATAIQERPATEFVELVAGFADDDLALAARSVLSERWASRLESTGEESVWRDEWLKWIEPTQVGDMVVHSPWHDPAIWSDWEAAYTLSIDPGRAFGSGHHPTTHLALGTLQQLVTPKDRLLDVGCGTGILSIAAAKLGAKSVLGIDLDDDILEVARANAEANDVASLVQLGTDPVDQLVDRYEVVVANIVIGDLKPVIGSLVERATRFVILSGFLDDQLDDLVAETGVDVVDRSTRDGWGCITVVP